jgi:hypothetical protein
VSEDTDQKDAVRAILKHCDGMAERFGPIVLARLLMRAGMKLMAQAKGRGEAQAELRHLLGKAHVRAMAMRDLEGDMLPGPQAAAASRVLPRRSPYTGSKSAKAP